MLGRHEYKENPIQHEKCTNLIKAIEERFNPWKSIEAEEENDNGMKDKLRKMDESNRNFVKQMNKNKKNKCQKISKT